MKPQWITSRTNGNTLSLVKIAFEIELIELPGARGDKNLDKLKKQNPEKVKDMMINTVEVDCHIINRFKDFSMPMLKFLIISTPHNNSKITQRLAPSISNLSAATTGQICAAFL